MDRLGFTTVDFVVKHSVKFLYGKVKKKDAGFSVNQSFLFATHRSGRRISGALTATSKVTSMILVIAASLTLGTSQRVKTWFYLAYINPGH